ncbi:membrane protein [Microbacterium phage Jemerald]|nr:membrane protein [Microbacterium phage Jemerald]
MPGFVTGSLALVTAVLMGFITSALTARREARKAALDSRTPGVPTVQQVWERQDKQERALAASLVLLAQAIKQHDDPGKLVLSKSAIKTLRQTNFMPPELEDVLTELGR